MLTHTDRGENLTHDLDVDISAVSHVLDLHRQGVRSGVSSLCRADEEDGVHVAGTGPHSLVLHEDAVLKPGHDGTGLSLQIKTLSSLLKRSERRHGPKPEPVH